VTWTTSVPVFLGLSVLALGPMYATDRRQERIIALYASTLWGRGYNNTNIYQAHTAVPTQAGRPEVRPAQYSPLQVVNWTATQSDLVTLTFDLWTSKWDHGSPVSSWASLLSIFSLLRPSVLDLDSRTGLTDGQTDDGQQRLVPPTYGGGT